MSVHCTPEGRWYVRFPKGKLPTKPNATREYFGRGPEAEVRARERNKDLGLGKAGTVDNSPLFMDLAVEYLKAKTSTMAKASRVDLETKLNGVILPRIGQIRGMAITPEVLDRYMAIRLKKVKRTTVHRDLSDIRAILRWSVKRKYISHNPMDGFEFPDRDDDIIEPPTVEEVQLILKHASPHLFRAIVLAYHTGLRPGEVELLRLTWEQVNLVSGHIVIKSAEKGGLKRRTVPIMDDRFRALLQQWLDEDIEAKKTRRDPVVTYKGRPIQSLDSAWNAAKRRAQITRRMRPYDLRHSFATKLLDNGADLKHVSLLLGHKSVQQTVDTYQHTSKRLTEEAVQKLPSIFDTEGRPPYEGVD